MSTATPLALPRFAAYTRLKQDLTSNCSRCNCGYYSIYSQCGHIVVHVKHICGRREIKGSPELTLCTFPPAYWTCNAFVALEPCNACAARNSAGRP